jgi:hypothetical protein
VTGTVDVAARTVDVAADDVDDIEVEVTLAI